MHKVIPILLLVFVLAACLDYPTAAMPANSMAQGATMTPSATLSPTPTDKPTATATAAQVCSGASGCACKVTALDALNMRAGPGVEYSVIYWLRAGDVLTILKPGTWAHVRTAAGYTGYINSNYCEVTK